MRKRQIIVDVSLDSEDITVELKNFSLEENAFKLMYNLSLDWAENNKVNLEDYPIPYSPPDNKTKIYIAGKVTGEPKHSCALKFATAQKELEKQGYEVVNPIEVVGDFNADWKTAMRKCIKALMDCDAIYMLPDWHDSKGAKIEHSLAIDLSLAFVSFSELNQRLMNHM